MESLDKIELKSEKVRSMTGKIPPFYMRYGILVISLIIVGSFCLLYLIKITEYNKCVVRIISDPECFTYSSPQEAYLLEAKTDVMVKRRDTICILCNVPALDTTYITAPFDGYSMQYVSNNSLIKDEQVLVSVSPLYVEKVYAQATVPFEDYKDIQANQPVEFHLTGNNLSFNGAISYFVQLGDSMLIFFDIYDFDNELLRSIDLKADASIVVSHQSILSKIVPIFAE